jgi:hypothetical protein
MLIDIADQQAVIKRIKLLRAEGNPLRLIIGRVERETGCKLSLATVARIVREIV